MTTYTITEKQNAQSTRKGEQIEALDLAAAKRAASRMQMFHGTVLTIEANGTLLAVKRGGKWENL